MKEKVFLMKEWTSCMSNLSVLLPQYKSLLLEIEDKEIRLNEIRSWVLGTASCITGIRKNIKRNDRVFDSVEGAIRLEKSLYKSLNECMGLLAEIEILVQKIPDSRDRVILLNRYIKGQTWMQIADSMGFACESVPRMRFSRLKKKLNLE